MVNILKAMYFSVQSCVRWGANISDFFACPQGVKQGCLLSPLIFSLLISGKHGIQLLPGHDEIFSLLFADDIVLVSSTPSGLQNQINSLEKASKSFGLTVNLNKTKVTFSRKGGHIAAGEKWFLYVKEIKIVNRYKYLGYTLTTKLSNVCACEDFLQGLVFTMLVKIW